jgi:hypothetical protein
MKLRYSKYAALVFALLIFGSCGSDFLEVQPKGSTLESNYYKNRDEAYYGLIAVYDVLGYSNGLITKVGALNSASDDHYAGGANSTDMNAFQVWSNYTLTDAVGPQEALWSKGYSGIFRANVLLEKLPDVPMDDNEKARFTAETKFLRAFFYFDLVRLFKNIPLITTPIDVDKMYDIEQAAPADVYAQIIQDIQDALPNLPNTVPGAEAARVTAGAAHALLGKVYLYQEDFTNAAKELAIVNGTPGQQNSTFGYKLVDNYGDLFDTHHEFNSESILEVSYTNSSAGNWNCGDCTDGNILAVMAGPRGFSVTSAGQGIAPNYVSGWSFFPITPSLVSAMNGDPRFPYTIADIKGLKDQGLVDYTPGYMDTGYFLEKYAGKQDTKSTGGGNWELNYPHNNYEIRLADTYLMEAEALVRGNGDMSRAQALLDAVRARVGLSSVPATFDNIFNERRLELAGEGHRWFDLVRTGRAADALAFKGFVAGKHEVLPIPLNELVNTKLQQNKEYGGTL